MTTDIVDVVVTHRAFQLEVEPVVEGITAVQDAGIAVVILGIAAHRGTARRNSVQACVMVQPAKTGLGTDIPLA